MFGFFKKKASSQTAEDLKRQAQAACIEVKEKWLHFHNTVHLTADVPLAQKINFFAQPLSQFFQTKYPQLLSGGSEIFWLTTFTAILEAGTHPNDQVNDAVAQLQQKHGRK